jgi:hypothetical protein
MTFSGLGLYKDQREAIMFNIASLLNLQPEISGWSTFQNASSNNDREVIDISDSDDSEEVDVGVPSPPTHPPLKSFRVSHPHALTLDLT